MRPTIAGTALFLALSLAACSEEKPAVCGSVGDLEASVNDVRKVDVASSGGLAEVKTDAESEFSSQLDRVEASFATLTSSVEAARTGPSGATLTAVGSSLRTFGNDVQALISDVKATC